MGLNNNAINFTSKRICAALRNYQVTGHADIPTLRHCYDLLEICRYISEPMSYALDEGAHSDASKVLTLFDLSIHDMQVRLNNVRIVVDQLMTGAKNLPVASAARFFETIGNVSFNSVKAFQTAS